MVVMNALMNMHDERDLVKPRGRPIVNTRDLVFQLLLRAQLHGQKRKQREQGGSYRTDMSRKCHGAKGISALSTLQALLSQLGD